MGQRAAERFEPHLQRRFLLFVVAQAGGNLAQLGGSAGAGHPHQRASGDRGRPHENLALVGGGAAGIELAMAIRHRLPGAALTLLTGGSPLAANYPWAVQRRVAGALKDRNITVE
mgnify:CR=1 FL=1